MSGDRFVVVTVSSDCVINLLRERERWLKKVFIALRLEEELLVV